MIVCPVCEHAQPQGAECDVCGRRLLRGAAGFPGVPPVPGLEPTRHVHADAEVVIVPGLEPTRHAAVEVLPEPAPELEPTRTAPVDVAVAPAPDIERIGEDVPEDAATSIPIFVTCRYCRTPAAPGERVCGRCGMRLPVFSTAAPAAPAEARCSCGAPVHGTACPVCGVRPR
jgi:hypothetical protein